MEAFGDQQITRLIKQFTQIDNDHDGFITKTELQSFMKKQKLFKVPTFKVNEVPKIFIKVNGKSLKQTQPIRFCDVDHGLQAGSLRYCINKNIPFQAFQYNEISRASFIRTQSKKKLRRHQSRKRNQINKTLRITFSSNQSWLRQRIISIKKKVNLIRQFQIVIKVLGRSPQQINCVFKLKTTKDGQNIADKISQVAELGLALASQLGPTAIPITQSIKITSKWHQDHVYLIVELKNTFMNIIVKFLKQAIQELISQGKFHISASIESDFSQVLQPQFDPFGQSLKFLAEFIASEEFLLKLKEKLVKNFKQFNQGDKSAAFMFFLFEEINLSMEFENIKECLKQMNFKFDLMKDEIKNGAIRNQLKQLQISEMIKQFLPEGDQFLKSIKQNCSPQGSLTINFSEIFVDFTFSFNIHDFFDLF